LVLLLITIYLYNLCDAKKTYSQQPQQIAMFTSKTVKLVQVRKQRYGINTNFPTNKENGIGLIDYRQIERHSRFIFGFRLRVVIYSIYYIVSYYYYYYYYYVFILYRLLVPPPVQITVVHTARRLLNTIDFNYNIMNY